MRIAIIATVACLLAPAAFAQDPQQLQDEHHAALQARDKLAAAASAAVAAKDWRLACIRSLDAIAENDKAVSRLQQLRGAIENRIDPDMLHTMSADISRLILDGNNIRQTSANICAEANKPS